MSNKVYVSNINFKSTEDDLKNHFGSVGNVVDAKIITDKDTGRSRGFAFVEMDSEEAAGKAIAELDGSDMDGRQITVAEAREREQKKPYQKKDNRR